MAKIPALGERYTFAPSAFEEVRRKDSRPVFIPRVVTGKVIYIHPRRRYFVAEAQVNGCAIREAFKITD